MNVEIALIIYNRPDHTREVLQGLKKEGVTSFSVFMDAANLRKDKEQQKLLFDLLLSIDWADIKIFKHKYNLGLAKSIQYAVQYTLQDNDAVIVLEDDCVPRPGFMSYMNRALHLYKNRVQVRSICAYNYPNLPLEFTSSDVTFVKRFCPWGWASWKDRWPKFNPKLEEIVQEVTESGVVLSDIGLDIHNYCHDPIFLSGKSDTWSINWILAHYLTDTYAVFPKISLIDNIGFDGSGVHCTETGVFQHESQGGMVDIQVLPKEISYNPRNETIIREFLEQNSLKTMQKTSTTAKKLSHESE